MNENWLHRALLCPVLYWYDKEKSSEVDAVVVREKKSTNVEIGNRLREIRENLSKSQAELAEILDVSDEHYRKLEGGTAGLTIEKIKVLYEKLHIDPTYLLIGERQEEFDLDKYLANCSKEQRDKLLKRCLDYIATCVTK